MKKMIWILSICLLLLFSVTAYAQSNDPLIANKENGKALQEGTLEQVKVVGLENAMTRVRNEEQRMHLEQVMNKIQEKKRQRLNQIGELTILEGPNGLGLKAQGNTNAKFLGLLPFKKNVEYQINEDGSVQYQKGAWDFLFKFEQNPEI